MNTATEQNTYQNENDGPPVAVVTGASAGIGRGAAVEIGRRGMHVVVTYNSRAQEAEKTVRLIREVGGDAVALRLDIARVEHFADFRERLAEAIGTAWGTTTVRALVNNAGFGGGLPFAEMTEDAFDQYYQVLLKGPYFLTQALLPVLQDGGSIVNVSSSSVRAGDTEAGYSGYAAMKGGLVTATRYLAKELAGRGIVVNSVAPGPTRTRIADDAFDRFPEIIDGIAARTTLGRIGEPQDVGKIIAFLVSQDAGWITGQDLQVSGGFAL
ncbi:SDR family NAD(P)-dependent oxidoreductase [Myceligenerans xiligouense]|uniref:SDR family NAD(P)-dependent oxidoreductase n=1 Tax=Myceligenerans xiligouense TaxID=253184 RepID=UPI001FE2826B|nr:SDR family oxidoreductase [Myceligenerans xiligouense]